MLNKINKDVNETKQIMKENILVAVDNSEKLKELDHRAKLIDDEGLKMKVLSSSVKKNSKFCSPGIRILIIIISIIGALVLCYFIASYILCGSANIFC